ncbi:MAG: ABC transporter ATP-binding protein [Candidatus Latescibacterota bacterium]|nr:MAG: ABC transporter ATP-binding protein [Candidatus Latescibacterota bacterium]
MARAIKADNLSKRFRIGMLQHETMLREVLVGMIKHPFSRIRPKKEFIWALRDVGFEVDTGEVMGIIGRNGAGKSTLLKVLSRITYPTTGSATVKGRVSSLLEVGTGFHEELTGRENVFLNGSILGMKKKEIVRKMDAIIDFAGVKKFVDTPMKRYSSGMKLRLGFAVAAHLEADVLLVDEVLAVGDADFQRKCLRAMDDLRTGGRTVLFVSHNMSAVENLCPRAIWIEGGRIVEDGEAKTVIHNYLSTFAQEAKSGYDLSQIESRSGNGAARFTAIEFLDDQGNPTGLIRSGEKMTVRLHFRVNETVKHPHFGFKIFSDTGALVTTISTWATRLEIPQLTPGEDYIDLHVDFLNLMPARYYVSLSLQSVGRLRYDILDHCAVFDVEAADVYGTGRGLDGRWGVMYMPGRWTYRQLPDPDRGEGEG